MNTGYERKGLVTRHAVAETAVVLWAAGLAGVLLNELRHDSKPQS